MNSNPSKFHADTAEGIVRPAGDMLPGDNQANGKKAGSRNRRTARAEEKSGAAAAYKERSKDAKGD